MAAGDGLISMKPTSIAHAGTSASINADGGVDFTAVTSLSLNGVFTSDYDNYLLVASYTVVSGAPNANFRLRASGVDATGSDYVRQYIYADSTSVAGARFTAQTFGVSGSISASAQNGDITHIYGPALAQPTAWRNVSAQGYLGAYIYDLANTHSLSTSYDGFTLYPNASDITGTVHVFGYEE